MGLWLAQLACIALAAAWVQGAPAVEPRLQERELEPGRRGERIHPEPRRLGLKLWPAEPDPARSGRAEALESERCPAGLCQVEQKWCLVLRSARSLRRRS